MSYTKKMTEGSELKHIILFTLPLFAGNVFQQLYNICLLYTSDAADD